MAKYTAADGTTFTDKDIERWSAEAEPEQEYTGNHIGPSVPGRPVRADAEAKPFTFRLEATRRAKLDEIAQQRNVTPPQLLRDLIDEL